MHKWNHNDENEEWGTKAVINSAEQGVSKAAWCECPPSGEVFLQQGNCFLKRTTSVCSEGALFHLMQQRLQHQRGRRFLGEVVCILARTVVTKYGSLSGSTTDFMSHSSGGWEGQGPGASRSSEGSTVMSVCLCDLFVRRWKGSEGECLFSSPHLNLSIYQRPHF